MTDGCSTMWYIQEIEVALQCIDVGPARNYQHGMITNLASFLVEGLVAGDGKKPDWTGSDQRSILRERY